MFWTSVMIKEDWVKRGKEMTVGFQV